MTNDFGVLCLGHKNAFCSTCKHHSSNCKHIRKLQEAIERSPLEDLPPQLRVFATCEIANVKHSHNYTKVISERKIPFDLSGCLKQCLQTDYSKRFNIQHGIAHLHPPLPPSSVCSECGIQNSWSAELSLVKKSFLVTPQMCYPAEGIITS